MRRMLALAVVCAIPSAAQAADKEACISAYEQTQTLRKDGKVLAAKAQAAVCARDVCPTLLAKDCTRWLTELEASTPSVVLEARSATGAELVDVRVKVDGAPLVSRVDGKAVQVEPGARTFRFEPADGTPVERMVVVREGEKNRRISVTLEAAQAKGARPVPLGVWIFGGVSVVALGAATVLTVDGLSRKSELDACKPRCGADDVDAMSARFTMADFALGAGVAAGAAAVYLFLTRPPAESTAATSRARGPRPWVVPLISGAGASAGVGGRF
jgi:hypothetical protein